MHEHIFSFCSFLFVSASWNQIPGGAGITFVQMDVPGTVMQSQLS